MSVLAVITARGGSKRIPHKNIKDFCGKPIIAYSIEAALKSGLFSEVMVSTDDEAIAGIAKRYGASVPFMRSDENAGDFATTAEVLIEVINAYKAQGKEFDTVCCLYPTAPFVTESVLKDAFKVFGDSGALALMPVTPFSFPPQRGMIIENGNLKYKYEEYAFSRSQDLEKIYHDAGQFYMIKTDILLKKKTLVPENVVPFILDEMAVQDIDNITDWKIAELKYSLLTDK